jgi:hypothetical protein
MEWNEIKKQVDADDLMDFFGGFHDSCIREAHLWTAHYVNSNLSMSCAPSPDISIRMLIQRQFENPSAIELFFDFVTRFNLAAPPEKYDSIILGATLLVHNGSIFWSPEGDWRPDKANKDDYTWISAKKLHWREVEWLGKKLWYGPRDNREV